MRRLSLTFDNGPVVGVTDRVLDMLDAHGAPATFFVIASRLRDPQLMALAAQTRTRGHRIGNHTLTHSAMFGDIDDPAFAAQEIHEAQRLIGDLSDEDLLFRPTGKGGHLGPRLLSQDAVSALAAGQHTLVLWNSVPRDWEQQDSWPDAALASLEDSEWTVLVLHDTTSAIDELPRFLREVERLGIELRTDFPDDCVPMRRGRLEGDITSLVQDANGEEHPR
ncbi:hypothetical protein GCM10025768_01110 [Microbacterium pseudoresistens]|uniref:Peptidoglycan/xylan/chitin deacetylase (PgdA/CDA1 family) n=1 Tax=Microbacterium pseudoresistens TaxID=640634 RepID=A0A7Y9JME6_9MICO|nr:polysaccharide deacetylase family protein [Microbacterium pseudoresistens]NYD53946.1 peptidoglycan/xylan/chitin deacetylase (PgdA/CDA1 family) [Microbacterium pseudoresistens]